MHFAPDENLIRQYLQDEEITRDFGAYYQLYVQTTLWIYRDSGILSGSLDEIRCRSHSCTLAAHAPTDELPYCCRASSDGCGTPYFEIPEKTSSESRPSKLYSVRPELTLVEIRLLLLQNNIELLKKSAWKPSAWPHGNDCTERIARLLSKVSPALSRNVFLPGEVIAILRHAQRKCQDPTGYCNRTSGAASWLSFAESAFGDGPEILFLIQISVIITQMQYLSLVILAVKNIFVSIKSWNFRKNGRIFLQEIDSVIRTVWQKRKVVSLRKPLP